MSWRSVGLNSPTERVEMRVDAHTSPDVHEVGRHNGNMVTLDVSMRGFECVASITYRIKGMPTVPPDFIMLAAEAWIAKYHQSIDWQDYLDRLFNAKNKD